MWWHFPMPPGWQRHCPYADSYLQFRLRLDRIPGIQVAVWLDGAIPAEHRVRGRRPGDPGTADQQSPVPDRVPLQDRHGDPGVAARGAGRAAPGRHSSISAPRADRLAGGRADGAGTVVTFGRPVPGQRGRRLLAAPAPVPRSRRPCWRSAGIRAQRCCRPTTGSNTPTSVSGCSV